MSTGDKIKNKAQEMVGKAKEKLGDATGNKKLKREGKADQTEAGMKQTGEKVKDGAVGAKEAVKDTVTPSGSHPRRSTHRARGGATPEPPASS